MDTDLKWLIGVAVSITLAVTGMMITSFRMLSTKISTNSRNLHEKVEDNHREVHGRIDNVKEKYVRRDDLDGHIERIDRNIAEMRAEQRDQTRQMLDAIKDVKS